LSDAPLTGVPDRALVLYPLIKKAETRDPDLRLAEACGLAEALDLIVVEAGVEPVRALRPATFFGTGKVDEIKHRLTAGDCGVAIIDDHITPVQQRNLEEAWNVKVIDRTGLILEIFARRARTREGKLQVELARLDYERSRLVRTWTHLERQRGGFGFFGGPGETQIEADRRLIRERMAKLKRQLEEVKRTRALHRAARKRVPYPVVALVGYTNAGKSSLFNRLTASDVFAKDMLFATLDPTLRAVKLPDGQSVILSDTVGFITDLPTELIAAFRATLEEVMEADILLHVRDIAHEESLDQARDVRTTLEALGLAADKPVTEVWNKLDLLSPEQQDDVLAEAGSKALAVSALTGQGVEALLNHLARQLDQRVARQLTLPASDGRALAWLHAHGDVDSQRHDSEGDLQIVARLTPAHWGQFDSQFLGNTVG
jgi:GTP-binding protein HflX